MASLRALASLAPGSDSKGAYSPANTRDEIEMEAQGGRKRDGSRSPRTAGGAPR